MNRYVVWDGDESKAEQLKQLYPYMPVYLYDSESGEYTRYTIEIKHRKPHMKNGRLLYSEQTVEI